MEIAIHSYLSASFLLENEPGMWSAIVILDSTFTPTSFVSEHAQKSIFLTFDDITCPDISKRTVERSHMKQTIEFAENTERLLVCCRAGQSRSAATAFVAAYAYCGRSPALRLLDATRHIPNKLVVKVAAETLGMPEVLAEFQKWQQDNKCFKLADFYDEIVAEVEELERKGAQNRIVI